MTRSLYMCPPLDPVPVPTLISSARQPTLWATLIFMIVVFILVQRFYFHDLPTGHMQRLTLRLHYGGVFCAFVAVLLLGGVMPSYMQALEAWRDAQDRALLLAQCHTSVVSTIYLTHQRIVLWIAIGGFAIALIGMVLFIIRTYLYKQLQRSIQLADV